MERRNTVQKELVLQAVRDLACHATADEIYREVVRSHPSVSKGTVYRNLALLSEEGKILHIEIPGQADRYDHNVERHYHGHCIHCNKPFDVWLRLDGMMEKAKVEDGFEVVDYDVVFKGICAECRKNSSNQKN